VKNGVQRTRTEGSEGYGAAHCILSDRRTASASFLCIDVFRF